MFTGIVTAVGTVRSARQTARGLRLVIAHPYGRLTIGESIAVDGACLTVVATGRGTLTVEAVVTTRGRTAFGDFVAGRRVNLERPLAVGDRLGGHLVAGHVDGVGTVTGVRREGDAVLIDLRVPPLVAALSVLHGSIAVDGCSMTVNALPRRGVVQLAVIPHTLEATTLGSYTVGRRVHLEADQVAKFVQQLLGPYTAPRRRRKTR